MDCDRSFQTIGQINSKIILHLSPQINQKYCWMLRLVLGGLGFLRLDSTRNWLPDLPRSQKWHCWNLQVALDQEGLSSRIVGHSLFLSVGLQSQKVLKFEKITLIDISVPKKETKKIV